MNHSRIVIDNFLFYAERRRVQALEAKFDPVDAGGLIFPGISPLQTNDVLSMPFADARFCKPIEFFRLTLDGDILPTYIHNDLAMARKTGVLYLNQERQCKGGTAFWKHKETGLVAHPSPEELEALGGESFIAQLQRDGLDESKWEQTGLVEMKWNRLLLFDSALFHSPYPRPGWGKGVEDGRLIQVYFLT